MLNNKVRNQSKGFTLVELAIVMTIIGLLIGGILKGQQMLQNSRVTATVAQIKAIEAATTSFRDSYGSLPGDLKNAGSKVPGCTFGAICTANTGRGNGSVGPAGWYMLKTLNSNTAADTAVATGVVSNGATTDTEKAETVLFWFELLKVGLISGVTDAGIQSGMWAFGKGLPGMKIGGGFWVGNNDGSCDQTTTACDKNGRPTGVLQYTLLGTILATVDLPNTDLTPLAANTSAMLPTTAAQLDRKIDDGDPSVGSVQAFGVPASCYTSTTNAPYAYKESVTTKDCGVYIRIQN